MSPKTFSPQIVQQAFFQQQVSQPKHGQRQQQAGHDSLPSPGAAAAVSVGYATMRVNGRASGTKAPKVRHWR